MEQGRDAEQAGLVVCRSEDCGEPFAGHLGLHLGDRSPHAATPPELLCFPRKAGLFQQDRS